MTAFVSSATLLLAAVSVLAMFSFSTVVLAVDPDEIPDGPVFEPTNAQVEKFHRVCKATTEAALSDEPGVYEANEEDIRFAEGTSERIGLKY